RRIRQALRESGRQARGAIVVTCKVRSLPCSGLFDALRRLVFSGCNVHRGSGRSAPDEITCPKSEDPVRKVSSACGCSAGALAWIQRDRLSQSAGVRQRPLLCQGNRTAKHSNIASGKSRPPNCIQLFREVRGTEYVIRAWAKNMDTAGPVRSDRHLSSRRSNVAAAAPDPSTVLRTLRRF